MTEAAALFQGISDHSAALVAHAARSIVAVQGGRSPTSGIHWRPGVVVTSEEGLERDEDIALLFADGRSAPATLAGRDPSTDIAALRCPPDGLAVAETGDAGALQPGALVLAVGRGEAGPVAAGGIVAVAGGPWQSLRGGSIDRLIRLDLRLSGAGEGGALIDGTGKVLGMTVPGPRHRVLAIPAATIDRVLDQLLAKGHVARGYLGAALQRVRLGEGGSALLAASIDPQGPAARAGLMVGDLVTAWAGEPVGNVRQLMRRLGPDSIGRRVELRLLRGGAATTVALEIGERPRG